MTTVVSFDPRQRLLKLTQARNILLILGILQLGFHGWVLRSLPAMLNREPELPEFVLRQRMADLAGPEMMGDSPEAFRKFREKDPQRFEELQDKAILALNQEREILKKDLLEKTPLVSWMGIGSGAFALVAALGLPWLAGGLAVIASFVFLGSIGVEIYQFGAGGLLNGILVKLIGLVLYFQVSRLALEAETGQKVK